MVKVSIIVPVFNVQKYLDRCLFSLVNQTLNDIEIILVDDGSFDKSPKICDDYAKKYNNIRVIHKSNEGLGFACNSGMEIAKGEYVAFCDSDDYVDFIMYETLYNNAKEQDADIVFSGIQTVCETGEIVLMNQPSKYEVISDQAQIIEYAMDMVSSPIEKKSERDIAMSAKITLYKHSFIKEHQLCFVSEREIISEDLIWNIDVLSRAKRIVTIPKTFYYYCDNLSSLSKSVRVDRFGHYKKMRAELKKRMQILGYPLNVNLRIDKMFIGYARHEIGRICMSSFPLEFKRNLVNEICQDDVWNEIWNYYPIKYFSLKNRVASIAMKHSVFYLLWFIYNLKKWLPSMRMSFFSCFNKLSLILPYLFDKVVAFFWKRSLKYCGTGVYIRPLSSDIKGTANLSIGDYTSIPKGSTIYCTIAPLTIGKKVLFGPSPTIITGDHRVDVIGKHIIDVLDCEKVADNDAPVTIEDGVWVGANVTILKGVTIGRGSVIAAGAVVTNSFPPYSIVGGVPARLIRPRFTKKEIVEHEIKLAQDGMNKEMVKIEANTD